VKGFAKRRPVLTYWLISVLLAGILIPIGLMVLDLYPTAFDEILESAGGNLTTNILYEFPRVLGVKGGVAIFLFYVSQPATPLIAALITASLIGRESVRDLASRWRFWSKEVGWKRGILLWLTAIATIVLVNLGIAWLAYMNKSPSVWPDYKLTVDLRSPTFWFLFLTSLFFDGGGLLEETGWRGFLLPRLQKTYSPLTAAIGVGVLHSLWHIPVNTDILLSSLPRFVLFYIVFTLHCILISIVISYFYNRLGGSTLIAIALHGLLNDSFGITGFCGVGGNISQQASQIYELLDLVPLLIVVLIILWLDGAWVGITFPRVPRAPHLPRHGSRSNHENRLLHLE
jgi:membrane protease YdiL (CAAX protease family)